MTQNIPASSWNLRGESSPWALWRRCLLAQVAAHRRESPQLSFPAEASSLPRVWFRGSQRLRTWESSVASPGPGATSRAHSARPHSRCQQAGPALWTWFWFSGAVYIPLKRPAPASSELVKSTRETGDVGPQFPRAPRGAHADEAPCAGCR